MGMSRERGVRRSELEEASSEGEWRNEGWLEEGVVGEVMPSVIRRFRFPGVESPATLAELA